MVLSVLKLILFPVSNKKKFTKRTAMEVAACSCSSAAFFAKSANELPHILILVVIKVNDDSNSNSLLNRGLDRHSYFIDKRGLGGLGF